MRVIGNEVRESEVEFVRSSLREVQIGKYGDQKVSKQANDRQQSRATCDGAVVSLATKFDKAIEPLADKATKENGAKDKSTSSRARTFPASNLSSARGRHQQSQSQRMKEIHEETKHSCDKAVEALASKFDEAIATLEMTTKRSQQKAMHAKSEPREVIDDCVKGQPHNEPTSSDACDEAFASLALKFDRAIAALSRSAMRKTKNEDKRMTRTRKLERARTILKAKRHQLERIPSVKRINQSLNNSMDASAPDEIDDTLPSTIQDDDAPKATNELEEPENECKDDDSSIHSFAQTVADSITVLSIAIQAMSLNNTKSFGDDPEELVEDTALSAENVATVPDKPYDNSERRIHSQPPDRCKQGAWDRSQEEKNPTRKTRQEEADDTIMAMLDYAHHVAPCGIPSDANTASGVSCNRLPWVGQIRDLDESKIAPDTINEQDEPKLSSLDTSSRKEPRKAASGGISPMPLSRDFRLFLFALYTGHT